MRWYTRKRASTVLTLNAAHFDTYSEDQYGTSHRLTSGPVPALTPRHSSHQSRSRTRYSRPVVRDHVRYEGERNRTNRGSGRIVSVRGDPARSLASGSYHEGMPPAMHLSHEPGAHRGVGIRTPAASTAGKTRPGASRRPARCRPARKSYHSPRFLNTQPRTLCRPTKAPSRSKR